jgi:hypothetical protein
MQLVIDGIAGSSVHELMLARSLRASCMWFLLSDQSVHI